MFLNTPAVRAIVVFSIILLLLKSHTLAAPIDGDLTGDRAGDTIPPGHEVLSNDSMTSGHLAKRADTSSFRDIANLRAIVSNYGMVGNLDSLFYSGLQGIRIGVIKTWYCNNIKNALGGDPYNPGNPARGPVAWDGLTARLPKFWETETTRLQTVEQIYGFFKASNGNYVIAKDTVQKRASQAFAEESSGVVYFFTVSTTATDQFGQDTAWGGWEYPALTRNPQVRKIVRVHPNVPFLLGVNPITVWNQGDPPTPNQPRGDTCSYLPGPPGSSIPLFGPC